MKSLFGNAPAAGGAGGVDTLIGRQTEVLGDVRFSGGLHVDGKIKGNVAAVAGEKSAALSVSESGVIEGDVNVPSIVLNGTVSGDVRAGERLTLAAKARVTGNVHYKVLQMEAGAMVNGQLLYQGSEARGALTGPKETEPKADSAVIGMSEGRRSKLV